MKSIGAEWKCADKMGGNTRKDITKCALTRKMVI